jgi:hypothetical protein
MAALLRAGVQGDKGTGGVGAHPVVSPPVAEARVGLQGPPGLRDDDDTRGPIAPPQKGLKF